jgi:hypothetical protein
MAVTSTTLAGTNVWRLSGAVTDAELKTAWAGLIVNNRYKPARAIYIDDTCSLANVRGTYYVDAENLGVILHLSRNKANTLFKNWFFTQTVGLAVGARANFVRFTNGTTITNSTSDGIDMQGGGMMYAVIGNPGGGDPRYLNEMTFGSLDGTLVTSAAFTEQELEPCSIGTIWRGLNIQKAAGYPILQSSVGAARQVIYRSVMNTESATLRLIRPYFNCSVCYVSTTIRRQGAAVTSNLGDTFASSGAAVIMALNNWLDESWFGAAKTNFTFSNWSANNRVIGGVMKKIQVEPSTVIRTYDSRSTLTSQKSTFSETTNDFLTGDGTTNLFLQSEAIDNAAWEKGLITVSANNTTAPDGTTTADRLVETTASGQHRTSNVTAIGVIPNVAHTFSFYAKPSGRNHVHARILAGGSATNGQACFDIANGTFIVSAGTTATMTSVGNGWYRCTMSAVVTVNTVVCYANLATSSSLTVPSYAGSTANGIFFWGAQLQSGTEATQYLQTTTTRADGYYTTTADASTGRAQFVSIGGIATGGGQTITRYTGQRFTLQKFGYRVQVETPDMTFGDDDLSAFSPITMAVQEGIERTESEINAATTVDSFQDLLEELHVLAIGLEGAASYNAFGGGNLFTYDGSVLTTNFSSVVVDATAASKISYNSATNVLTVKSSVMTDTDDVAEWRNPSGTISLANGAEIRGVYASSAGTATVWEFQSVAVGSSLALYNSSGTTLYYRDQVTSAGDYAYYIPPGTTGTYTWAIEKYGSQRQSGTFAANTGGLLFYVPIYVEDVGITETTQATVAAYTEIENAEKFYDYTAFFRLGEQGIKIGQIATRSGTSIEVQSGLSHVIRKTPSIAVYAIAGGVITTKAEVYAGTTKYSTEILVPPATLTAHTTEIITIAVQDANGDSQVTINGGDGNFELWKVTEATPTADYATGTLLDTVGNGIYRFIGVSGFDIVGVDTNSNIRRRTSMAKGIYTQAFYVGDQIQLAQAPEVLEILTKVEILQVAVDDLPQEILDSTVETGATVVESLRLHNSVLGGKVSGGGSGVETFRDLADTKDRLVSTNTATGDRSSEVYDLT